MTNEEKNMYITSIYIYEKNILGDYANDSIGYRKEAETLEEAKDITDILWEAAELDLPDKCTVMVSTLIYTDKDEYIDCDDFEIKFDCERTTEPSKFIKWGNKKPHIFGIDRTHSRMQLTRLSFMDAEQNSAKKMSKSTFWGATV